MALKGYCTSFFSLFTFMITGPYICIYEAVLGMLLNGTFVGSFIVSIFLEASVY